MIVTILNELQHEVREFATARDWLRYHTPKNLVMAIAGESGELVAEFQWLTSEDSAPAKLTAGQRSAIESEMADVFIYLLRLSDVLQVDLAEIAQEKLKINETRFPILP